MLLNLIKSFKFSALLFYTTAKYYILVVVALILNRVSPQADFSHRIHHIAQRWGQELFHGVPGWKLEITGREHLPQNGGKPCVIVANHESATDILAIYFLGIPFRWLSKDTMFRVPMFGAAMTAAGYIPIKRGDRESHRKALEDSAQWLKNNVSMLFFPEGTRSTLGKPKEFKIGAFKLAAENQTSILPVVLHGAGKLLKKGTLAPYASVLKIKVLPQVDIEPGESVHEFTKRVETLIHREHALLAQRQD